MVDAPARSAFGLIRGDAAFRALWTSRAVSFIGTSLSLVALILYVADRVRTGLAVALLLLVGELVPTLLNPIAGALAATRPEAAAIILGAAEAHVLESARTAQLINSTVAAALGEQRTRELCAHGADMDWDQAVAYNISQTTQALSELQSEVRE